MGTIHLLTPEYPPATGGVAGHTRQLARGLAAAGETVHVWAPTTAWPDTGEGFEVHPEFGKFGRADLERVGRRLDGFEGRRRLFVQWVPQGYGFRAMNVRFCVWLWTRARRGDHVEIMVHEPYLAFWEGSWRQTLAALVHRVMTVVLLRASRRVWVAIPAWEPKWRPYALGRPIPFAWLPIPSALPRPDRDAVAALRGQFGAGPLIGHLGTYGRAVSPLLRAVLAESLARVGDARVVLLGAGSDRFRADFLASWPEYTDRVTAAGVLSESALAAHVGACDLLVQPYPDGISSRRTTAMAGLHLGVPVVTTIGALSDPCWEASGAVRHSPVGEVRDFANHVEQLLGHPDEQRALAARGSQLYEELFGLDRIVSALRAAA